MVTDFPINMANMANEFPERSKIKPLTTGSSHESQVELW
jgi:hypothetical protein